MPIGSSPRKYSRAIARLMMATCGAAGPSASVKYRPRTSVAPSVWKYDGAHLALRDLVVLAVPRPAEHAEPRRVAPSADGQHARHADRRNAGQAADALDDPPRELQSPARACRTDSGRRGHLQDDELIGPKPGVDTQHEVEAAREQARARRAGRPRARARRPPAWIPGAATACPPIRGCLRTAQPAGRSRARGAPA